MIYQTRHMVALQDMRYMGRALTSGEAFEPTEVDATYFEQHGIARHAPAPVVAPVVAASVVAAPALESPRRGRPPKAAQVVKDEPAPVVEPPVIETPAAAPDEPQPESPFVLGASSGLV